MKKIPTEITEQLEKEVPEFIKAVHSVEADAVMMMLDAFAGEPELFYNCIWYATSHGKSVTITASSK